VEVWDFQGGEQTIALKSMEDLVKVADELGKPLMHQAGEAQPLLYFVLDGAVCYQFSPEENEKNTVNPPAGSG
jgi:hypothetical protein